MLYYVNKYPYISTNGGREGKHCEETCKFQVISEMCNQDLFGLVFLSKGCKGTHFIAIMKLASDAYKKPDIITKSEIPFHKCSESSLFGCDRCILICYSS